MLNKTTLAAAADTIAQEWTGDDVSRAIYSFGAAEGTGWATKPEFESSLTRKVVEASNAIIALEDVADLYRKDENLLSGELDKLMRSLDEAMLRTIQELAKCELVRAARDSAMQGDLSNQRSLANRESRDRATDAQVSSMYSQVSKPTPLGAGLQIGSAATSGWLGVERAKVLTAPPDNPFAVLLNSPKKKAGPVTMSSDREWT